MPVSPSIGGHFASPGARLCHGWGLVTWRCRQPWAEGVLRSSAHSYALHHRRLSARHTCNATQLARHEPCRPACAQQITGVNPLNESSTLRLSCHCICTRFNTHCTLPAQLLLPESGRDGVSALPCLLVVVLSLMPCFRIALLLRAPLRVPSALPTSVEFVAGILGHNRPCPYSSLLTRQFSLVTRSFQSRTRRAVHSSAHG